MSLVRTVAGFVWPGGSAEQSRAEEVAVEVGRLD